MTHDLDSRVCPSITNAHEDFCLSTHLDLRRLDCGQNSVFNKLLWGPLLLVGRSHLSVMGQTVAHLCTEQACGRVSPGETA